MLTLGFDFTTYDRYMPLISNSRDFDKVAFPIGFLRDVTVGDFGLLIIDPVHQPKILFSKASLIPANQTLYEQNLEGTEVGELIKEGKQGAYLIYTSRLERKGKIFYSFEERKLYSKDEKAYLPPQKDLLMDKEDIIVFDASGAAFRVYPYSGMHTLLYLVSRFKGFMKGKNSHYGQRLMINLYTKLHGFDEVGHWLYNTLTIPTDGVSKASEESLTKLKKFKAFVLACEEEELEELEGEGILVEIEVKEPTKITQFVKEIQDKEATQITMSALMELTDTQLWEKDRFMSVILDKKFPGVYKADVEYGAVMLYVHSGKDITTEEANQIYGSFKTENVVISYDADVNFGG